MKKKVHPAGLPHTFLVLLDSSKMTDYYNALTDPMPKAEIESHP
jgi:hypothetical protein